MLYAWVLQAKTMAADWEWHFGENFSELLFSFALCTGKHTHSDLGWKGGTKLAAQTTNSTCSQELSGPSLKEHLDWMSVESRSPPQINTSTVHSSCSRAQLLILNEVSWKVDNGVIHVLPRGHSAAKLAPRRLLYWRVLTVCRLAERTSFQEGIRRAGDVRKCGWFSIPCEVRRACAGISGRKKNK